MVNVAFFCHTVPMKNSGESELTGRLGTGQSALLQNAIMAHGNVVTFEQLHRLMPERREDVVRRIVSRLVASGWLVRVRKGVYEIAELASLGTVTLPVAAVAQILAPGSYVSHEWALNFHGYYDQFLRLVTSVSVDQHPNADVDSIRYTFIKSAEMHFWGFDEVVLRGYPARMAHLEKAIIDMQRVGRNAYTVNLAAEVLAAPNGVDLERMADYLLRSPLSVLRVIGFVLETLGRDVDSRLFARAQATRSISRVTLDSTAFNARWRLMYEPRSVELIQGHLEAWQ